LNFPVQDNLVLQDVRITKTMQTIAATYSTNLGIVAFSVPKHIVTIDKGRDAAMSSFVPKYRECVKLNATKAMEHLVQFRKAFSLQKLILRSTEAGSEVHNAAKAPSGGGWPGNHHKL
jgi:3-phosphoglycerate kinase